MTSKISQRSCSLKKRTNANTHAMRTLLDTFRSGTRIEIDRTFMDIEVMSDAVARAMAVANRQNIQVRIPEILTGNLDKV
jgi:hypothetical protein